MVSLTAVEGHVAALWPDHAHAVVSVPDPRKGEQLVLVTAHAEAARAELQQHMQEMGASEILVPRTILALDALPLLGTGKLDYVEIQSFAEARVLTPAAN
jgi:acyl-[acyl-carrier-protein]-phospholipid O-acyltransferase/long-chain-fatty-acid--[acyl-carrier-protein] ligase